jgi:hypothetical protein
MSASPSTRSRSWATRLADGQRHRGEHGTQTASAEETSLWQRRRVTMTPRESRNRGHASDPLRSTTRRRRPAPPRPSAAPARRELSSASPLAHTRPTRANGAPVREPVVESQHLPGLVERGQRAAEAPGLSCRRSSTWVSTRPMKASSLSTWWPVPTRGAPRGRAAGAVRHRSPRGTGRRKRGVRRVALRQWRTLF